MDSNSAQYPDGSFKYTQCFLKDDLDRRIKDAIHEASIQQIKTMVAAKDRFIRCVFHEIRTPMHAVLYGLENLSVGDHQISHHLAELKHQVSSRSHLLIRICNVSCRLNNAPGW